MHDKKSPDCIKIIAIEIKVLFLTNIAINMVAAEDNKDIEI